MTPNLDGREMLKQKESQESKRFDYSFIDLTEQSDSEIKWVKLHQMFDK